MTNKQRKIESSPTLPLTRRVWGISLIVLLVTLTGLTIMHTFPDSDSVISETQSSTNGSQTEPAPQSTEPVIQRTDFPSTLPSDEVKPTLLRVLDDRTMEIRLVDAADNPVLNAEVTVNGFNHAITKLFDEELLFSDNGEPQVGSGRFYTTDGICRIPLPNSGASVIARSGGLHGKALIYPDNFRQGLVIRMLVPASLKITVLDSSKQPVAEIPVSMVLQRGGFVRRLEQRLSDTNGEAEFNEIAPALAALSPGSRLVAVVEGAFNSSNLALVAEGEVFTDNVTLHLPGFDFIRLEARSSGGRLLAQDIWATILQSDSPSTFGPGLLNSPQSDRIQSRVLLLDGSGFFPAQAGVEWSAICQPYNNGVVITAEAPDQAQQDDHRLFVFNQSDTEGQLNGRIVAPAEQDVEKIIVSLWDDQYPCQIKDNGNFSFSTRSLPPPLAELGPLGLTWEGPSGWELGVQEFFLEKDMELTQSSFDLGDIALSDTVLISLQVVNAQNEPIPGADIEIIPWGIEGVASGKLKHGLLQSGPNGQFMVYGESAASRWFLRIQHHLYSDWSGVVPNGQMDERIVLERLAEVRGSILLNLPANKSSFRYGCRGDAHPLTEWEKPCPTTSGPLVWGRLGEGQLSFYISDATTGEQLFLMENFSVTHGTLYEPPALQNLDLEEALTHFSLDVVSLDGATIPMFTITRTGDQDADPIPVRNPCYFSSQSENPRFLVEASGKPPVEVTLQPGPNTVSLSSGCDVLFKFSGIEVPRPGGRLAIVALEEDLSYRMDKVVWLSGRNEVNVPIPKPGKYRFQLLWDGDEGLFTPMQTVLIDGDPFREVGVTLGQNPVQVVDLREEDLLEYLR
jgi:hypothetical protein